MKESIRASPVKKGAQSQPRKKRNFSMVVIMMVIVGKRVDKYKKRINEVKTTVPVNYDS